jgi:hypothetical protein
MTQELSTGLRAIRRAAAPFIAGIGQVLIEGGWDGQDPGLPARRLFLDAVSKSFPDVLLSLRKEVLPVYEPAIAHEGQFRLKGSMGPYNRDQQPYWRALAVGLEQWGARWRLGEEWILRAAEWTLHCWREAGSKREGSEGPTGWWFATTVYSTSNEEPFRFQHPGWMVGFLSRKKAEADITTAFKNELHHYLEHLEALALARGYREAGPSRARPKMGARGNRGRRYEWLARWQVGQESQAKLAEQAGVDSRTVARALKQTAEEIGLTRRSAFLVDTTTQPQANPPH